MVSGEDAEVLQEDACKSNGMPNEGEGERRDKLALSGAEWVKCAASPPNKRGRGRPPKRMNNAGTGGPLGKRSRGRPRKATPDLKFPRKVKALPSVCVHQAAGQTQQQTLLPAWVLEGREPAAIPVTW
jgi:hypothetical protein